MLTPVLQHVILTWLLAVVAQALTAGANLGIVSNVAALVACSARKRRHPDCQFSTTTMYESDSMFFCGGFVVGARAESFSVVQWLLRKLFTGREKAGSRFDCAALVLIRRRERTS